jgi:hypothetical protein
VLSPPADITEAGGLPGRQTADDEHHHREMQ